MSSGFLLIRTDSKTASTKGKNESQNLTGSTKTAFTSAPSPRNLKAGSWSYLRIGLRPDPAALYRELLPAASLSRNRHVLHSLMFPCKIFRNDHAVEHFTS